jgi:membrane-associated protein
LPIHYLWPLLIVAVFCGDNTNYWLGHYLGPKVFHDQNRWLKREHLNKTHAFYEKHGPKAIILARFVPIIRTFMPFVAGVGAMTYKRFISWSFVAAVIWVSLLLNLSYYFGGIPWVKTHFSVVILAIIILSLLPPAIELLKARAKR